MWQEGRPSWKPRFSAVAAKHNTGDVGVAFCGNKMIASDLKKQCYLQNQTRTDGFFKLHKVRTQSHCLQARDDFLRSPSPAHLTLNRALITALCFRLVLLALTRRRKISESLPPPPSRRPAPHRAWPLRFTHRALINCSPTAHLQSFPFLFPIPVYFHFPVCFSLTCSFLFSLFLSPCAARGSSSGRLCIALDPSSSVRDCSFFPPTGGAYTCLHPVGFSRVFSSIFVWPHPIDWLQGQIAGQERQMTVCASAASVSRMDGVWLIVAP